MHVNGYHDDLDVHPNVPAISGHYKHSKGKKGRQSGESWTDTVATIAKVLTKSNDDNVQAKLSTGELDQQVKLV